MGCKMNMKRVLGVGLPLLALLSPLALPASAHHSHAMYDSETEVTLVGTITEYHWVNPHTWIYLEVEGVDGQTREWVIEGGGPGTLTRRGWSGNTFTPGERVTAKIYPIMDGSSGGLLGIVIKESGEEFDGN
jgi:hypothetical protein